MRKGLDRVYDFNSKKKFLFYQQFFIESEELRGKRASLSPQTTP